MSEHNSSRDSEASWQTNCENFRLPHDAQRPAGLLRKVRSIWTQSVPGILVHAQMKNLYVMSGGKPSWNCGRLVLNSVELLRFQIPRKAKHPECGNSIPVHIEFIPG